MTAVNSSKQQRCSFLKHEYFSSMKDTNHHYGNKDGRGVAGYKNSIIC
jgi:hypothetical protein